MLDFFKLLYNSIKIDFNYLVLKLNSLPVEFTWIFFLFFCFIAILIFLILFGEIGLYIYTAIAIISANIQVLKVVEFSFFSDPVALGTILFCSTFLCTDILAENYGYKKAQKNILIGFISFLFMTIIMIFTIGFKPLSIIAAGDNYQWALEVQENLKSIFIPMPTFFFASMIAYLISQYFDVWFFSFLSRISKKKNLWLRNNLSTITSSLIDNTVFSLLAFIILTKEPIALGVVISTYILGTYILRLFIAIFDTPFIYIAKYVSKNEFINE